jgi:hypothetical protein
VAALGLACLLWVGSAAAEGHWVEVQGPWVDTPGLAQDCAATDQPETWLVADSTSLLELTIPLR